MIWVKKDLPAKKKIKSRYLLNLRDHAKQVNTRKKKEYFRYRE